MTKYNQSFKQQVIDFYLQHGKNRSLTLRHFQITDRTLRRWIQQYNHNSINGLSAHYASIAENVDNQSQKSPSDNAKIGLKREM